MDDVLGRAMRTVHLLVGCVAACSAAPPNIRLVDKTYFGIMQNKCYPEAQSVWISVWNGGFQLPLPYQRHLTGTVTADGVLTGSGTWLGSSGQEVHATVNGRISSSWFGYDLRAKVSYEDCRFTLDLSPNMGK